MVSSTISGPGPVATVWEPYTVTGMNTAQASSAHSVSAPVNPSRPASRFHHLVFKGGGALWCAAALRATGGLCGAVPDGGLDLTMVASLG